MSYRCVLIPLVLFGMADVAFATSVPMKECANCSQAQMLAKAKNHVPGIVFIYDLAHNVIRKFNVFLDSTCGSDPVPQNSFGSGQQGRSAGDEGVECGSFHDAEEWTPVDPDIQAIFNSLRQVWLVNPTLAKLAKATRADPPVDPNTHQPFDLARVAFDYPQGSFLRFKELLRDQILATRGSANAFIPGLGDEIYGVSVAVDGAHVGFPEVIEVSVALDRPNSTIHLDICNANGDCAKFDVKIVNGDVDNVIYNGVFDVEDEMYPSESGQVPGSVGAWHWQLGPDADHFRQGLLHNGVFVPTRPGCGADFSWKLVIARVNGHFDSATWTCVPNN
jgi:hypothetical protein